MQPITVIFCDFQCHPELQINPQALIDQVTKSDMVEDALILSKGYDIPPAQLTKLRGKKIVFAGCLHMEGEQFYEKITRQLRMTEFVSFDAITNVFYRYEAKNHSQMLLRQIEAFSQLLDQKERYTDRIVTPNRQTLVYGSGLSGLSVAAELAGEGISVDVVETPEDTLSPGCLTLKLEDPRIIDRLRKDAQAAGRVRFLRRESLQSLTPIDEGYATITETMTIHEYGSIIFAPERREAPSEEVGAWTLSQLFSDLAVGKSIKGTILFILDLHTETKPEMVHDALIAAKTLRKKMCAEVTILLRNVRVSLPGVEELYTECRDLGVVFIKYRDNLKIENDHGDFIVEGFDPHTGSSFRIEYPDKLILPGRISLPSQASEFARLLKLRLTREYYTQPESLWQSQHESNRAGVFVVGAARGNMDINSIREDAASLVYSVRERLLPEGIKVEEYIPMVDEEKCAYCLTCIRICPFGAMKADPENRIAMVVKSACHACGSCAAECPAEAIQMRNLSNQAVLSSVKALLK